MASLSYVCNELLEAVLLFMGLQHEHVSRASLQQLKPELAVSLTAESSSTQTKCSVRVAASGLGAYFLDGNSFLSKLCEHGLHLRYLLLATTGTGTNPSQLKLFCRRIGDHANVVVFELQGFSAENDRPLIRESVVPRPQDFPPAGLVIRFPVNLSAEVVHSEARKLSAQLHLMHLVNPEVPLHLSLRVMDNMGTAYTVQYDRESYRHVAHSPYKLITALHHYMNPDSAPARQSRLYLLKGGTQTIPKVSLKNGGSLSLKLYCTAAVTPHLPLRNGRKIPANKLCNSLHIWVFGPFQVPLLSAGAQANCLLGSLAEWENYGLSIGLPMAPKYDHISTDYSPVVPSIACEVTNSRSGGEGRRSSVAANRTLKLFIFLEPASSQGSRRAGSDNEQWRQNVEVLYEIRRSFDTLVVTHSRKFHQALHSVLNKLICNYGTHEKTSSVMGTAIPMIAEAVSSIVQHSRNEQFKTTCRELIQSDNKDDVEMFVTQKLWRMAREKLKISHPSDGASCNPDEPTSPEIIQATSDADVRTTKSRARSTITPTTDETQPNTPRESEGCEPDTGVMQCTQEPDPQSQRSSEIVPLTFNTQSLFQARISSKRTKKSTNESKDLCTEDVSQLECTEPASEDTDYFDALTRVEEDMDATTDCVLTCPEADYHADSQMEECSFSLLGSSTILQPVVPPPSAHPPTPSPAPPPLLPSLSTDSSVSETAATEFDELESVGTEDEFSTVFGSPPVFEEAHHSVLEREGSSSHLGQPLQAARQGTEQEIDEKDISGFHELEYISEIGSSVDDGSVTDWEVDFDGAFSTEGEELEDTETVACVPDCGYVQTPTESATTALDQNADSWPNDSEWNDLTVDSPILLPPPNQRETPAISILQMQYSNSQHSSAHCNSLLEYPKCDGEETAGYMKHEATELCTNATTVPCVSQVCVSNDSPQRRANNDSWDLSDFEWDQDDFEESTNIPTSLPASGKPSTQNSDKEHKYKPTNRQHPQQTVSSQLEASTVPDIMNESLTCDVAEDDFHWD